MGLGSKCNNTIYLKGDRFLTEHNEDQKKKIAFFSTIAPGDTARIETMLGYARAAAAMDYEILIFYALDSALVAKRQIFEKMDFKIRNGINDCLADGVMMHVCSASAQTFGIAESDVIEGAEIGGIASFYLYAENADIVLSWS